MSVGLHKRLPIASFVFVHQSAAHSEAGKVGREKSVITEVVSEVVACESMRVFLNGSGKLVLA